MTATEPDAGRLCRACGATIPEAGARFCSACGAAQRQPSDDPNIGTVVAERYRLIRLLGEGASGRVYEARQSVGRSERRVAVKVLRIQHADNPRLLKRVEREVEIACSLAHPSTIRVFDFGETRDGRPFIVMEFVDGTPLASILAGGALPLERVASIFSQICGALAEAHEHGIVHRDLKPENIMVMRIGGQSDLVKLLDFGIAKHVKPETGVPGTAITEQGMVVGTPEYMSPEQFGGGNLGPATDIYALGVIAYEALTGRLPFEAETPIEWAAKHALDPPLPFESTPAGAAVPEAAREVVLRALAKEAADRPPTVSALYAELFMALPHRPALGHWSQPPPRPPSGSIPAPPRTAPSPVALAPEPPRNVPPTVPDIPPVAVRAGLPTTQDMVVPTAPRRGGRLPWILLVVVACAATAGALAVFWDQLPFAARPAPPPLPPPPPGDLAEPVRLTP